MDYISNSLKILLCKLCNALHAHYIVFIPRNVSYVRLSCPGILNMLCSLRLKVLQIPGLLCSVHLKVLQILLCSVHLKSCNFQAMRKGDVPKQEDRNPFSLPLRGKNSRKTFLSNFRATYILIFGQNSSYVCNPFFCMVCWKFLGFCVDCASRKRCFTTCVPFKKDFLDSDETAHGMDHTKGRATGDVALPLGSGRGWASDWRKTWPNFPVIPWTLIPQTVFPVTTSRIFPVIPTKLIPQTKEAACNIFGGEVDWL